MCPCSAPHILVGSAVLVTLRTVTTYGRFIPDAIDDTSGDNHEGAASGAATARTRVGGREAVPDPGCWGRVRHPDYYYHY